MRYAVYLMPVFSRYDPSEVEGPAPEVDTSIDEADYSVEKWKEVIWQEVKLWDEVDTTVAKPDVKTVVQKNKQNKKAKDSGNADKKDDKTDTAKADASNENIIPANTEVPVKKS